MSAILLSLKYESFETASPTPRAKTVGEHAEGERPCRVFAARIAQLCGEPGARSFTVGQLAIWLDLDRHDAHAILSGGKATAAQLERVMAIVGRRAA